MVLVVLVVKVIFYINFGKISSCSWNINYRVRVQMKKMSIATKSCFEVMFPGW